MGDNPAGEVPNDLETTNEKFAEHFGMSDAVETAEDRDSEASELLDALDDQDVDPVVASLLEHVVDENQRLRERVDDLEDELERTHDVATTAVGKAQGNESTLDDLEEQNTKTREIAKSAVAKANQVEASTEPDVDDQEDAEDLPQGVEPSTSPLDFFANCRAEKLREMFTRKSNKTNSYRAIMVAKRWPEFADESQVQGGKEVISWERDDLREALTAFLGERPHRQTVTRVWERLRDDLGGDDVTEGLRGQKNGNTRKVLRMDVETAEGLLESRYIGMDLLEDSGQKATTGGVTPVVTGAPDATA